LGDIRVTTGIISLAISLISNINVKEIPIICGGVGGGRVGMLWYYIPVYRSFTLKGIMGVVPLFKHRPWEKFITNFQLSWQLIVGKKRKGGTDEL